MSGIFVDGDDEIIAKLRKLSAQARGAAIREAVLAGAMVVETQAKINVRELDIVDTSFLMNSIQTEAESNTVAKVSVGAEYGVYHEFGTGIYASSGRSTPWRYKDGRGKWHMTRGVPARPYLFPALRSRKEDVKRVIRVKLEAAIRRAL